MQPSQRITAEEVLPLLHKLDDTQLRTVIPVYQLSLETVQSLKDYSAQFHFTEPERARQIAQAAYRLGQQLPAPAPALGAWAIGNALLHIGRYAEAEQMFLQARAAYLAQGNQLDAARMAVGYVGMLAYNGRSEAALQLAAEVEPLLTAAGAHHHADLRRLGNLLMNCGIAQELSGAYEEALILYERQMAIAQRLADPLMLAQMKHNRAYALAQIGALAEAAASYQEAEQLLTELDVAADLIRLYTNYAALLAQLGHYQEARQRQNAAEALLSQQKGGTQQHHWLAIFRATLEVQAGWPVTANTVRRLQTAQGAFRQTGPAFAVGLTTLVLGSCYLSQQQWQAAQAAFTQARAVAQQAGDRLLAAYASHGLGQVADQQNQIATAICAYTEAIEQIESTRKEFHIEILRADFLTNKLRVYQDLVRLYTRTDQLALAFQTVERAKARLLTEKMAFRLSQEATNLRLNDDEEAALLTEQLQQMLQQLDLLYHQGVVSGFHAFNDLGKLPSPDTTVAVAQMEQQVQRVIRTIQQRHSLFSIYATGEPASLAQIQSHLSGKLLLQYHVNQNEVWVFVADQQWCHWPVSTRTACRGRSGAPKSNGHD
ncbi:MAG: tetratricopeptide repeat protein [Caldilineaceae bacterium]